MNILPNTTVGEVVKTNFKTARLFHSSKIDFCCGGTKTISEACDEAGMETGLLIKQLETMTLENDPVAEFFDSMAPDQLCDYIVKRHHSYVRNSIGFLLQNLEKICRVHGANHPELFEVNRLFTESSGELVMHMQKEELMLFPYIRNLVKAKNENTPAPRATFGSVANPVEMMISEHLMEGKRFEKIAKLTGNYSVPEDACTTYKVTLNELEDFENDLHQHIHLENNILFPEAIELEKELVRKYS